MGNALESFLEERNIASALTLRFEAESGDGSCWKLWMDNNDVLRHRQEGQEVQLRAGERKANPPGHPHNLGRAY